jgi:hypothetical protein
MASIECDCKQIIQKGGQLPELEFVRTSHLMITCDKCKRTYGIVVEVVLDVAQKVLLGQNLTKDELKEKYEEWAY